MDPLEETEYDQSELDSMEEGDLFDSPDEVVVEDAPVEPQEAPEEEAPTDTAPEPEVVAEVDADPASELDTLRSQVQSLQGLLQKLASNKPIIDVPPPEQVHSETLAEFTGHQVPPAPVQAAPQGQAPLAVITEEQYDEIMSDPAKFSAYMRAEMDAVRREAVQEAYALAMQNLPSAVLPTVYESSRTQMVVEQWAQANPLVNENREMAATILTQVDGVNPHLPLEKKLELTGAWINQVFGKPQANTSAASAGAQAAAFARPPRGARPVAQDVNALQQEMDELSL
jgi:hypothetical protein